MISPSTPFHLHIKSFLPDSKFAVVQLEAWPSKGDETSYTNLALVKQIAITLLGQGIHPLSRGSRPDRKMDNRHHIYSHAPCSGKKKKIPFNQTIWN